MKRAVVFLVVCCMLLPLAPFAVVKLVGEGLVWVADWCMVGRRWSSALVAAIDRVVEMGERQ